MMTYLPDRQEYLLDNLFSNNFNQGATFTPMHAAPNRSELLLHILYLLFNDVCKARSICGSEELHVIC